MLEVFSEYDEAERLFLPNFTKESFGHDTGNKSKPKYPEHFSVVEYQKLSTAVERRTYRNSKDLRNKDRESTETECRPEHSDSRLCYTQLRGQKCLDPQCVFIHEFRVPRHLRLCNEWKKGCCADGQSCVYLHSEYPCHFHYLGLNYKRHDPKNCRFYHGGPLPKEYEEMFIESLDLKRYPKSREMYDNRLIQLKAEASNTTIAERQADSINCHDKTEQQVATAKQSIAPTESEIDVNNEVIDQDDRLKETVSESTIAERDAAINDRSTEQQETEIRSVALAESETERSVGTVADDKGACNQRDHECEFHLPNNLMKKQQANW